MTPAEFIDNPCWADFIPEFRESQKRRHLPSHDDCSRLDEEGVASHLKKGGTLGGMSGYEERAGQLDMLRAVIRSFNAREHLMIEAGTGVGKSLAYLIPAIHWAWTNDTPVVVSTATRNLQGQLVNSDIPKALTTLGEKVRDFKFALLKGRSNYLCLRALGDFFAAGFWTMSEDEQQEMPHLIDWLEHTEDGDLDLYDGLPRALLTCPGEECGGRHCRFYSRCFVYRARKKAAEAHLVVANHSLVLAEASSGGGAILPAYSRLVLDEAHNLESIATDALSDEFSMAALTRLLSRLSRRGRGRMATPGGVLASVARQLQKGMLSSSPAGERVRRLLADATSASVKIIATAQDVFAIAGDMLKPAKENMLRYRKNEAGRAYSVDGIFHIYENFDEEALFAAETAFESAIAGLVAILHDIRDALVESADEIDVSGCEDLATQVDGLAENFVEFANCANRVLSGDKDDYAYWVERVKSEKRRTELRLVAAPLSVAEPLQRLLYSVKDSVVLTSATLRVGNDFKYMKRRLGCEERFEFLEARSPFDYFRQSLVLAPDTLADPSSDPVKYAEGLASLMKDLFAATAGRALVLFTSYEMMNTVASHARCELAGTGIELLVQGEGASRETMAGALRHCDEGEKLVLFGAQSFWEGVDIAGEALSCVVIARLPFAQKGDPIVEARGERIARNGGSSFFDYAIPEAVIKFRQGFGRLIRSRRDRGVVVITDPRIVTKNYGAIFRKSIPATVRVATDIGELIDRVREFFG